MRILVSANPRVFSRTLCCKSEITTIFIQIPRMCFQECVSACPGNVGSLLLLVQRGRCLPLTTSAMAIHHKCMTNLPFTTSAMAKTNKRSEEEDKEQAEERERRKHNIAPVHLHLLHQQ